MEGHEGGGSSGKNMTGAIIEEQRGQGCNCRGEKTRREEHHQTKETQGGGRPYLSSVSAS